MPLKTLLILALLSPVLGADLASPATGGLSPEEAVARMQVAEGFAVDLVAAEPDIVQPIAMCFDARGRLWVAEAVTYPQRAPEGQGTDRILILEDGDGDGKFETRKVFAEKLNLVSGLEVGFGGVFVGAAPYLLFIPDADGDDRPDGEPRVILDGFGYQDTHETLNSFIWGPDGWLWGCHGIFSHSKVGVPGTPDERRIPLNAGVWRFHPVTKTFEVVSHGTSNPWGLDFNDWGDAFVEACVIPHLWHMIPGGHYQRQAGVGFNPAIYDPIPTIADHQHWTGSISEHAHWGHENAVNRAVSDAGGGHAHSGFAICLSDAFPASFRNDAFFFNIHGHRMNHDKLVRNGSGWTGKHAPDVMLSNDQWFLGVSIRPGPDGAFYCNDWYDATSCHRTDPLRWDRGNGRIYRLRHGDLKPWKGDVSKWSDLQLAQAQAGRDEWALRMARRVLQERSSDGKRLAPEAVALLKETMSGHPDETRRLRAMWALHACGKINRDGLHALIDDPMPGLRAWAVRFSAEAKMEGTEALLAELAGKEESPRVQLELCSAMQRVDREAAMTVAMRLAPRISSADPNLVRMLWFGMEQGVPAMPDRALKVALSSDDPRLLSWVTRRMEPGQGLNPLFQALEENMGHHDKLLKAIGARLEFFPEERLSPAHAAKLARLDNGKEGLARILAARAGDPSAIDKVWKSALSQEDSLESRRAAVRTLGALPEGNEERWKLLLGDTDLRFDVLEANPRLLESAEVEAILSGLLVEEKNRVARLALRSSKLPEILRWLKTGRIRTKEVSPDVAAILRESKDPALKEEFIGLFGNAGQDADERREQISSWEAKLTPQVLANADPRTGREIFDRTCGACHRLFNEGGGIGPELTGGDRGSVRHWLDNILDPNALIGEGYELCEISKKDGTSVVGMLAGENDREYILKLADGESRVPKSQTVSKKMLGISMMPEGLLTGLSDDEVAELIRYLASPRQVERH